MNTRSLFSCLLALMALAACTSPPDLPPGGCLFDADCESPLRCVAQACRAPCRTDADCLPSQVCTGGDVSGVRICTARMGERACVYSTECPKGQVCTRDGVCRAQCQNNYDCQVINPYLTCSASRACELVCSGGTANCDGDVRNGCEVVLATDARHCGSCNNACVASGMSSAACVGGRCVNACPTGFADCDMSAANGCEADLSNAMNCGACGTRCAAGQTCTRQGDSYQCANAACPPERDELRRDVRRRERRPDELRRVRDGVPVRRQRSGSLRRRPVRRGVHRAHAPGQLRHERGQRL